ncbi:MAG: type II 3-dehydroquinate dehydratase [Flavobacteriaceae bacterium]|nr:MAG: type II 3-dehydroquinate dehydratase [Flavobacteriaceae bacterium]
MKILIINGPNLNLLGKREPEIYGTTTFEDFFESLKQRYPKLNLEYFQSNHEGELIDKLHQEGFSDIKIVMNPGALTHYSYAIADAIKAISAPVVEVHISDISAREEFRRISVTSAGAKGLISGKGLEGYALAIEEFSKM